MTESMDQRRGSIPLDPADAGRPRSLTREEILSDPLYPPKSDTGGSIRVVYEGLRSSACEQGLLYVPVGQAAPAYRMGAEHLITVLEGRVEFAVGDQLIVVEKWGQVFIPANVTYQYRNVGEVGAWFHNVRGSIGDWPYSPPEYQLD